MDLVGYRNNVRSKNFSKAINQIFIVFSDSKEIIEATNSFYETIISRNTSLANDKLIKIYKSICKNLKISTEYFDDSNFIKVFNPTNL